VGTVRAAGSEAIYVFGWFKSKRRNLCFFPFAVFWMTKSKNRIVFSQGAA
jgi:hypothetical protein